MLTNPAGVNNLTRTTIGSAIRVHQHYGPGLVESVYDEAFTYELRDQGLEVATRVSLPWSIAAENCRHASRSTCLWLGC